MKLTDIQLRGQRFRIDKFHYGKNAGVSIKVISIPQQEVNYLYFTSKESHRVFEHLKRVYRE